MVEAENETTETEQSKEEEEDEFEDELVGLETEGELSDEEGEFIEDEDEDEDGEEERETIQVTETVSIVKQPIITTVQVSAELDSKGVVKPACRVSIERHIDPEESEQDEFDFIAVDFAQLSFEVEQQIKKLKESLNT